MSIKNRLQTNNIDLSSILNDINNLPPAGTEDVSEEITALTEAVNTHYAMIQRKVAENNGEGEYVWNKYDEFIEEIPAKTGTIGFSFISESGTGGNITVILQTTLTNITNAELAENLSILSGVACANYYTDNKYPIKFSGSSGVLYNTTSVGTYTFDQSTGRITLHITNTAYAWDFVNKYTYNTGISITKPAVPSSLGNLIGYVVSDDETAYPDGGLQDGYWYELGEGLTPEMFGYTKMAVDKITFSNRTLANTDINHSLGEKPSLAFFICTNDEPTYANIKFAMITVCTTSSYSTLYEMYNSNLLYGMSTYSGPTVTDKTIRFLDGSYGGITYFAANVEYTLITMA